MTRKLSDVTQGLIDLASDVSHDPDEQDWYDLEEYLSLIPNNAKVVRELIYFLHEEYL